MKSEIIMFMPSIEGGGVEKNFFIISNYLSKLSKVSVITISNSYKKKFNKKIEFISLKSHFWDNLNRRYKYFFALFLLIIKFFRTQNKIVFCFQANIYAIIICKIFSVKIIARSNSAPYGWSKNIFKRNLFRFFLNRADKVIVNSFEFKKDLKNDLHVNAECIYNPLNKNEIIQKSKLKAKRIFKKNNILKIINVGRFTDQKDQITLLRALNEIKNKVKFQVIIMGKGILKKDLTHYIQKNKLDKNIKLVDFKSNPFPAMNETDLFILSSKYEGLPNVLLEALTLKKFVISSNCRTGPKEILLNGNGGYLFKVGDYKALSKLITKFTKNKKSCKLKLKKSVVHLKRFDYELNLKRYYNLINSLA